MKVWAKQRSKEHGRGPRHSVALMLILIENGISEPGPSRLTDSWMVTGNLSRLSRRKA